jgi:hypothetical protein
VKTRPLRGRRRFSEKLRIVKLNHPAQIWRWTVLRIVFLHFRRCTSFYTARVIHVGSGLSAFGAIADMKFLKQGRDGPIPDSCIAAKIALFDHLVSASAQRRRHVECQALAVLRLIVRQLFTLRQRGILRSLDRGHPAVVDLLCNPCGGPDKPPRCCRVSESQ